VVRVELDHNIPVVFNRYDIQLFVPAEFANLLEVGVMLGITLEQG
jgi:hypothetical protein